MSEFEPYLQQWDLEADGSPIRTHSSRLLPVLCRGEPAMLKVATAAEERIGAEAMFGMGLTVCSVGTPYDGMRCAITNSDISLGKELTRKLDQG